ncbi:Hint domain-containing protein [Sulfitobacter sp.]|uniref:Hint domain-containing protein n=1 Tax=Sulfitobacter sp. TaxID=1903071 RepID=UPI0030038B97
MFRAGYADRLLSGLRKIEDLRVGDPVITQDNGMQKIGWIGKTTVSGQGRFAPVHFAKSVWPGATGGLTVSPQHRMLVKGYQSELLFGRSEVLVPALHMIDGKNIVLQPCENVTYIHIMFEQHEIIFANGIPAESFHPASYGVSKLAQNAREELFALFPELRSNMGGYGDTARMSINAKEAKVLNAFSATQINGLQGMVG